MEVVARRILIIVIAAVALLLIVCSPTYADTPSTCVVGNEPSCPVNSGSCSFDGASIAHCTDPAASNASCTDTKNCGFLTKYVQPFVNFLSALVGVAVTVSIVIGGIQYGSSAGDSAKVSAAKNRIRNSIIALLAFLFLYAMMNFLIPGGLV